MMCWHRLSRPVFDGLFQTRVPLYFCWFFFWSWKFTIIIPSSKHCRSCSCIRRHDQKFSGWQLGISWRRSAELPSNLPSLISPWPSLQFSHILCKMFMRKLGGNALSLSWIKILMNLGSMHTVCSLTVIYVVNKKVVFVRVPLLGSLL